ncbi:mannonate oxidoreductase [Bacteroidia bacterium]|nr:mannonate oxidoreductase [Bacteroidia bacterium]
MENFKIGDKVRFINAVGDGVITRVLDKNKVLVRIDGFDVPCLSSDIIVTPNTNFHKPEHAKPASPAAKTPSPVVTPATPAATPDEKGDTYELSVAFLPPKNEKTEVYLLNDSPYQGYYCIGFCKEQGNVAPLANGYLEPDSKLFLKTLSLSELQAQRTLWTGILLFKNIDFLPAKQHEATLTLNPADFRSNDAFKENDFFDDKALIFTLLSSATPVVVPQPQPEPQPPVQDVVNQPIEEKPVEKITAVVTPPMPSKINVVFSELKVVDIRAVILRSQIGFLSEKDLLHVQRERAIAGIESLVNKQCKKCVLVYGIGSQEIKQDLQTLLSTKYPQLQSQDASQREYHYGAISVTNYH